MAFPNIALYLSSWKVNWLVLHQILHWFLQQLATTLRKYRLGQGEDGEFVCGLTPGEVQEHNEPILKVLHNEEKNHLLGKNAIN